MNKMVHNDIVNIIFLMIQRSFEFLGFYVEFQSAALRCL